MALKGVKTPITSLDGAILIEPGATPLVDLNIELYSFPEKYVEPKPFDVWQTSKGLGNPLR
ncbi:MAG: hypothetical protein DRR19_26150 [Candidatus Parabeggiatoa sp. nov. 1]|nr:MAG: hypothetical protein DRR19_26150 [Gammaproteobacteria bacterium]